MPAVSEKQRRLMAAALHGATFTKARDMRDSMTRQQLQDFTRTTGVIRNTTDLRHTRTRPAETRAKGR